MNEERQERINELATGSATCTLPHKEQLGVVTMDLWQVYGQWKTPRRRRAALLELGVRPRLVSNTAGSGLGPSYLAGPKPPLWGFPMLVSYRSDFQR
jgi:hypothetical protein